MREVTLNEKAMMLKALIMMDLKIEKFDEAMPDALSEFLGEEFYQARCFFFRALGFPQDTYYSIGYDEGMSFCDDFLHEMLDDMKYLVNLEDEYLSDYRLGNENDPSLVVFEEKVLELEAELVKFEGIE